MKKKMKNSNDEFDVMYLMDVIIISRRISYRSFVILLLANFFVIFGSGSRLVCLLDYQTDLQFVTVVRLLTLHRLYLTPIVIHPHNCLPLHCPRRYRTSTPPCYSPNHLPHFIKFLCRHRYNILNCSRPLICCSSWRSFSAIISLGLSIF